MLKKSLYIMSVLLASDLPSFKYSIYEDVNTLFYLAYTDSRFEDKIIAIYTSIPTRKTAERVRIKETLEITLRVLQCHTSLPSPVKEIVEKLRMINNPQQLCIFNSDFNIVQEFQNEAVLDYLQHIKQYFILESYTIIPEKKRYDLLLESLFSILLAKTLKQLLAQSESFVSVLIKKISDEQIQNVINNFKEQLSRTPQNKAQLISKIHLLEKYIPQNEAILVKALTFFMRDLEQLQILS